MNAPSTSTPSLAPPLPAGLPAGSRIEPLTGTAGSDHALLLVPRPDEASPELVEAVRAWVAEAAPGRSRAPVELPVILRLYNVDLIWSPHRSAAIAAEERFESVRSAAADFTSLEAELTDIEAGVAAAWPAYEGDLPLAYGFSEATLPQRAGLQQRYAAVMSLHGRLARLTRRITQPAPQPPTLAGQIGERLRERLRVEERDEATDGELEVLCSHYDACGQRASDYTIARRESMLSWTIIVLLATETILFAVELLSSTAGT